MKIHALLLLSLRSVGRNVRRSALTAAAMALGLALLIFSRAIAEGGHEQWIESAVRLGTGHIAIQAPDYLETARLEHRLDSTRVRRVIRTLGEPDVAPEIRTWAPRLTVGGLASSASSALPVSIVGVDPERERVFSTLPDHLREGRYLEPGDRLRAFVGVELARRLDLKVGDRFVLTAQTASGEVEGQMMRVAGTFHTGIQEMDEGVIHVPIQTARRWLGVAGAVTTVAVLLDNSRETDAMVRTLRGKLDGTDGIRVLGWRTASPEMDSAVRIDDYGDYLFHVILFAIIALAILNAVMMSVLGRRREFGILQALGLTGGETGFVVLGRGTLPDGRGRPAGHGSGLRVHVGLLPPRAELRSVHGGHDRIGRRDQPRHRSRLPRPADSVVRGDHRRDRDARFPLSGIPRVEARRRRSHEIRTMTQSHGSAVRTEDVWKIYPQEPSPVEAVRGLTLDIAPGDFVAMAGPSGSGKTTVLNLMGALTHPTRGRIWVGGEELTALNAKQLARLRLERIGFVFQAYNLLPVLTALENAEFTLLLRGVPAEERHRRVRALFEEIGLGALGDRRPGKLSGGQQQRVAVARAVVGEPALVLADEPTANLDSVSSDSLLDVMERLNQEHGTTFVFSTHDPRVMERARRLVRLVDGRIASDERRAPASVTP